jgi:hypothetical protein
MGRGKAGAVNRDMIQGIKEDLSLEASLKEALAERDLSLEASLKEALAERDLKIADMISEPDNRKVWALYKQAGGNDHRVVGYLFPSSIVGRR